MNCRKPKTAIRSSTRSARIVSGFLLLLAITLGANAQDERFADLMGAHGWMTMVDFVLDRRHGQITIDRDGMFKDTYGRPARELVTPASLARDATKLGLDSQEFGSELEAWLAGRDRSGSRTGRAAVPAAGAQGTPANGGGGECALRCERKLSSCRSRFPDDQAVLRSCASTHDACVARC